MNGLSFCEGGQGTAVRAGHVFPVPFPIQAMTAV